MIESIPIRTAVILAAGLGRRLRALWGAAPKGLLPLGGVSILERSIQQLLQHGVTRIVLVTGYQATLFAPLLARYPAIESVHNPHYATSGSMYSLYCARDLLWHEPFLLLDSDLIYEDRALCRLLATPAANALLVSGFTGSGDEIYVEAHCGEVRGLSKHRDALATITGEMVGITKVGPALFQRMVACAEQVFATTLHFEYCSGCLHAVAADSALACCKIDDLIWAEIDDEAHWQRATETVFPRLLAASEAMRPRNQNV